MGTHSDRLNSFLLKKLSTQYPSQALTGWRPELSQARVAFCKLQMDGRVGRTARSTRLCPCSEAGIQQCQQSRGRRSVQGWDGSAPSLWWNCILWDCQKAAYQPHFHIGRSLVSVGGGHRTGNLLFLLFNRLHYRLRSRLQFSSHSGLQPCRILASIYLAS